MGIIGFHNFAKETFKDHTLINTMVVIDAQNFFYDTYQDSGIQFAFGCESEKYAQYLRNYLNMFKKANVKCFFIFKGGIKNFKSIEKKDRVRGKQFVVGEHSNNIIMPIAMKEVHKQVLDEMDFDYTTCKFDSRKECIALAETLGCAVISNDVEFCFAGISYVPYPTLSKDIEGIRCKLFKLENFLRIYNLTEDKFSTFIALTDNKFGLENYTDAFKKMNNIRSYGALLKWLSLRSKQAALDEVSNVTPSAFRAKLVEAENEARNLVNPKATVGVPSLYLTNRNTFEVKNNDPLWFEKGVAARHIAIPYINLYHHGSVVGSWSLQDENSEDAILLSMELIIYAYNLLTNYNNIEIKFVTHDGEPKVIKINNSVPKPNYAAEDSVFENGWCEIKYLGLFEHFLKNTLTGFDYETLENLPDDAKLLMVALIYFSAKKPDETTNIVYSVLLSYIALSVVLENTDANNNQRDREIITVTTNKSDIFLEDVTLAKNILQEYFDPVSAVGAAKIFDRKLNHGLLEFQHCLENFNFLNKLCGSPYKPTIYSKTFNGTFVYKIFYQITIENGGDGLSFVSMKLNPAASVLAFFNGLAKFYSDSVNGMCT